MKIPVPASALAPAPVRVGTHVDVYKDNLLVSTTRPCPVCGLPLTGVVVTDKHGKWQRHIKCPTDGRLNAC